MDNKKDKKMKCTTTKDGVKICFDSSNPPKAETSISSEGQYKNAIEDDSNWKRLSSMPKGRRY